jgi:hypothetical protein
MRHIAMRTKIPINSYNVVALAHSLKMNGELRHVLQASERAGEGPGSVTFESHGLQLIRSRAHLHPA